MIRPHVPLPFLVALLAGACATGGRSSLEALNAQTPREFRGHFTTGADGSWFRSCGAAPADSAWWATVTGAAAEQLADARRAGRHVDGRPSYVQWRAVLTTGGEIGPRGRGAPALLVRDVATLRPAAASDCAP